MNAHEPRVCLYGIKPSVLQKDVNESNELVYTVKYLRTYIVICYALFISNIGTSV